VLEDARGARRDGVRADRVDDDRGHPDRARRQHRRGAGRDGRRREVVSVRTRAGKREEQTTRRHRPRVELDGARDADPGRLLGGDVGEAAADDVGDLGQ
jgi:hypothetical protein